MRGDGIVFYSSVASFGASPVLRERLVLLNRQLRSRRQRLMAMRRENEDFAILLLLMFPFLVAECAEFPRQCTDGIRTFSLPPAPEQVWAELARLAGSMLTFPWSMITD